MEQLIYNRHDEAVTSSLLVAEKFHKRHPDAMRKIRQLESDLRSTQNCTDQKMFFKSYYTDVQNKTEPIYFMNRDGFSLLVMGFTGKEALEWKLKYIQAFNDMEHFIKTRVDSREIQKKSMAFLHSNLELPEKKDYIKANQITNKATSLRHGYPKLIKKDQMSEDMLVDRDVILQDTIELMAMKEKFNLDVCVSEKIYQKYAGA